MLPEFVEPNLAELIMDKLTGDARKCIVGTSYTEIENLIDRSNRAYVPDKAVYQLQGKLKS